MRYMALGGGNEVGASCNFIELDGRRLLVDAGIRMHPAEAGGPPDPLPDLALLQDLGGPEAVLVTHAHLDHIGALPLVHQAFPGVMIYATAPTVHLMRVLLADAIKIMAMKADQEMECPLYSEELVASMFRHVVPVPMGGAVKVAGGIRASFFPAGHILGASMVGLEGLEGRVLITGDIAASSQRTIPGLAVPRFRPHLMVMESTYGNRMHASRHREEKNLARAVAEVVASGGHALVPAFALGRAQEIILLLQAYQQAELVPKFPIWVDGMVRSICQTYVNFPQHLQGPVKRVINNGGNPFYRDKALVAAVTSSAGREKVLAGAPSCIVSSSGMLSGGPSQFYAARLVGDERNAILLCGYQDEESPGRRLMDLAGGNSGELVLGGQAVQVKCQVASYGLSAHADAGEMSALVSRLKPRHLVLVHGDNEARQALSRSMAGEQAVLAPENGEELSFTLYQGRLRSAAPERDAGEEEGLGRGRELDLGALWEHLVRDRATSGQARTAEELAGLWFGRQVTAEQQEQLAQALGEDQRYFAADWKHPFFYRPRRPDQVAADRRREEIMRRHANLPGHLVLLRDASGAVRAGICHQVDALGFAAWKVGQEGVRHPAESLLEVIGPWPLGEGEKAGPEAKTSLHRLLQQVRPVYRSLRPRELWIKLRDWSDKYKDLSALARELGLDPSSQGELLALAWRLNASPEYFERSRGGDGLARYRPRPEAGEIKEEVADNNNDLTERMEQNAALAEVESILPPTTGLYRKGLDFGEGKIILYFEFPDVAGARYRDEIDRVAAATGWGVSLHPEAHHGALAEAVYRLLPEGWQLLKNPSIHRDTHQVAVKLSPPEGGEAGEVEAMARRYNRETGWQLAAEGYGPKGGQELPEVVAAAPASGGRMEINQAYGQIRERLTAAGARVYRAGKKQGPAGEFIEVGFISPEVGARYLPQLEQLAAETGWGLRINPRPNQNEIKTLVRSLMKPAWGLRKEPGFFADQQEVRVILTSGPPPEDPAWQQVVAKVKDLTGYTLVKIKVQ